MEKTELDLAFNLFNPKNWGKYALLVVRLFAALWRDIREGNLTIHAAGLAYITIVTIVPLLAICFSVLKVLGIHNQMEPLIANFLEPLGVQGNDIAVRIVTFVDNIKVGVLGLVGLVMLVYGVMSMMRKVEAAFNDIWRVRQERSMARRLRDYSGILFVGPLFMALSVVMAEMFSNKNFFAEKMGMNFLDGPLSHAAGIIPYVLFIFAFTALYMFMPNTRVRFIPALAAGVLATVAWKIMGKLFGVFVVGAGGYAAIYSAFAALMLLMIWIYLGWLIALTGAAMAYYIQNPQSQTIPHRFRALSARVREKAALLVCSEIGRVFYAGEKPLTLHELAVRTALPPIIVADIAEALIGAEILAVTGKNFRSYYTPRCSFNEETVDGMFRKLRAVEEEEGISFGSLKASKTIDEALKSAETLARPELAKMTLKQLAD